MSYLLIYPDFHIDPLLTLAQMPAEGPLMRVKFLIIGSRWVTVARSATSQVANMVVDRETNVPQFKQKGS